MLYFYQFKLLSFTEYNKFKQFEKKNYLLHINNILINKYLLYIALRFGVFILFIYLSVVHVFIYNFVNSSRGQNAKLHARSTLWLYLYTVSGKYQIEIILFPKFFQEIILWIKYRIRKWYTLNLNFFSFFNGKDHKVRYRIIEFELFITISHLWPFAGSGVNVIWWRLGLLSGCHTDMYYLSLINR